MASWYFAAAVLVSLLGTGCIRGSLTVAKPTALELQLLGAYDELDKELVHAGSVRAGGPQIEVGYEQLVALAVESRATQRFNEDDLLELKARGCLAEGQGAKVVTRPCQLEDEAMSRRQQRIVEEENRARGVILTWAAHNLARKAGRRQPTAAELNEIRQAYQRLLFETAKEGQLLEREPGQFAPAGP